MSAYTAQFKKLPSSIQTLLNLSVKLLAPKKIILFGSRARGDHRDNSDFDIAFEIPTLNKNKWSQFLVETDDAVYTLYKLDLVDLESLDQTYKNNIAREGVELYVGT